MSKTRLISAFAAGFGILAAACWFVTSTFPLAAEPQVVRDAPGVSVEMSNAQLLHRAPVGYPEEARRKGVQGAVTVEATLDGNGAVTDARVISGPQELRRAAVRSVFEWHFTKDAANSSRLVTINFQLPAAGAAEPTRVVNGGVSRATLGAAGGVPDQELRRQASAAPEEVRAREREIEMTKARIEAMASAQQQQPSPQRETQVSETRAKLAQLEAELARAKTARVPTTRILKSISISGLPDSARDELAARLPVHIGDALTEDLIRAARDAVAQYDSHLRFKFQVAPAGETYIEIAAPAASLEPIIRVGGNVQSAKLRRQPRPVYPPEAKAERVQGAVHLMAIIAADGTVKKLEVIDGHPLLVQSALEAVRQWEYEPTYLNGEPVEVQTQIDVNYTLAQ